MHNIPDKIDSKFRFVLLAARRAEQLMRGGRAHLETTTKKPTQVAQREIEQELVGWDYGPAPGAVEEVEESAEEKEEEVH